MILLLHRHSSLRISIICNLQQWSASSEPVLRHFQLSFSAHPREQSSLSLVQRLESRPHPRITILNKYYQFQRDCSIPHEPLTLASAVPAAFTCPAVTAYPGSLASLPRVPPRRDLVPPAILSTTTGTSGLEISTSQSSVAR